MWINKLKWILLKRSRDIGEYYWNIVWAFVFNTIYNQGINFCDVSNSFGFSFIYMQI